MLPVRCFTCNKVLGHLETSLETWKKENKYDCNDPDASMESFYDLNKIERYCCKKILLTFHNENALGHIHTKYDLPPTISVSSTVEYPRIFLAR